MLSFNQLQEKKTKIKINPKKEDVMEGSCGSYSKGGEVKKNHGEDCDCQKCEKKRRKEDLGDEKTVSTEELAYDSQEKVSEEGNQEIAETEIKNLLTFDELQYAKTLNEEQLQEFLKGLLGGGSKPTSSSSGQMPSHAGLASRLGQRRQMLNKAMGKTDTKVLGFSKGGKVKKEEVEQVDEIFGALKGVGKAVGKAMSAVTPKQPLSSTIVDPKRGAIGQILSKGGKVKKEEVEVQEGRAEDAKKSLDAVKKRQGVLDNYEKKTGTKLDISKTPEHKAHKQNFPGAKRTGKKVKGAKETDLQKHNRRVQTYTDRLKKYGKTTKQKRDDDAMSKQTSRYD